MEGAGGFAARGFGNEDTGGGHHHGGLSGLDRRSNSREDKPRGLPPSNPHPPFGSTQTQSAPMVNVTSSSTTATALNGGEDIQWSLKDIYWQGRECKIITQNMNGPCSLIALCNILLLRGELTITPPDRPVASYDYLSQLIGEYLLTKAVDGDGLEEALSTLPKTQHGLDVDVGFDSISSFHASSSDGGKGELALFRLCGVPLVHGWLPDPADTEIYQATQAAGSYNRATDIVVRGDELADGAVVRDRGVGTLAATLASEASVSNGKQPATNTWTDEQRSTIRQALTLQSFLDTASTQLTYHGLFVLAQELPAGQPVALFRNSHLSVLYKRLPHEGVDAAEASVGVAPPPTLFTLATDSSFLLEDEIVWESLVDVDGASSEFYDGKFRKSRMRQGDYVGREAEDMGRDGSGTEYHHNDDDADYALAMQIYQNDQDRIERQQERMRGRQSQSGTQRSRNQQQSQPQQPQGQALPDGTVVAPPPVHQTPNEVFTTMRYESQPRQDEGDALVASTLIPAELQDEHFHLLVGLESVSIGHSDASAEMPAVHSANPFSESNTAAVPTSISTNPFLNVTPAPAAAANPAPSHRLYQHVPLLTQHLERLKSSAGAMCRAYSSVWSMTVLERKRALDPERILEAIEASLSSAADDNGTGQVKGIRVAISKFGDIKVTQRAVSPFPSTVEDGLDAANPSVRIDFVPTRVRTLDLEPLVFNKTDARGFYDAAKQRVGADSSVLSGMSGSDELCFDVLLWNDEQTDTLDAPDAAAQPKRLVTESSLANIIVELKQPSGGRSRFVTPRTSTGMLDGLLRRWMVSKHLVEEEDVNVDDLYYAVRDGSAQIWLCNSLRGVWKADLLYGPRNYVPPGLTAGQRNRSRFSQLMRPNRSNSGTAGQAAASSNNAPFPAEQRPAAAVHDQAVEEVHSHKQGSIPKKGKKGKKGKDDKKDCIIM